MPTGSSAASARVTSSTSRRRPNRTRDGPHRVAPPTRRRRARAVRAPRACASTRRCSRPARVRASACPIRRRPDTRMSALLEDLEMPRYFQLTMSASSPSPPGLPSAPYEQQVVPCEIRLAGEDVDVGTSPRIERHRLAEIRRAPVRRRIDRRLFPQRVESLFRASDSCRCRAGMRRAQRRASRSATWRSRPSPRRRAGRCSAPRASRGSRSRR